MLVWNVEINQGFLGQVHFVSIVFILHYFILLLNKGHFILASIFHLPIFYFLNLDVCFLLVGLNWILLFWLNEGVNQEIFYNWEHFLSFCYVVDTFKYWILYFLLGVTAGFLLTVTKYFFEFLFLFLLILLFSWWRRFLLLIRNIILLIFIIYLFHCEL